MASSNTEHIPGHATRTEFFLESHNKVKDVQLLGEDTHTQVHAWHHGMQIFRNGMNRYGFTFGSDENILELDGGDGYATL